MEWLYSLQDISDSKILEILSTTYPEMVPRLSKFLPIAEREGIELKDKYVDGKNAKLDYFSSDESFKSKITDEMIKKFFIEELKKLIDSIFDTRGNYKNILQEFNEQQIDEFSKKDIDNIIKTLDSSNNDLSSVRELLYRFINPQLVGNLENGKIVVGLVIDNRGNVRIPLTKITKEGILNGQIPEAYSIGTKYFKGSFMYNILKQIYNLVQLNALFNEDRLLKLTESSSRKIDDDIKSLMTKLINEDKQLQSWLVNNKLITDEKLKFTTKELNENKFGNILLKILKRYYSTDIPQSVQGELFFIGLTFFRDALILTSDVHKKMKIAQINALNEIRIKHGLPIIDIISPWLKIIYDENGRATDIVANVKDEHGYYLSWLKLFLRSEETKNPYDDYHAGKTGSDGLVKGIKGYVFQDESTREFIFYDVLTKMEFKLSISNHGKNPSLFSPKAVFEIPYSQMTEESKAFVEKMDYNIKTDPNDPNSKKIETHELINYGLKNSKNVIETIQRYLDLYPNKVSQKVYETITENEIKNLFNSKNKDAGFNVMHVYQKQTLYADLYALAAGELVPIKDEDGFIILFDNGKETNYRQILLNEKDMLGKRVSNMKFGLYTPVYEVNNLEKINIRGKYYPIYLHGETFARHTKNGMKYNNIIPITCADNTKLNIMPAIFYEPENKLFYSFKSDMSIWTGKTAEELRKNIKQDLDGKVSNENDNVNLPYIYISTNAEIVNNQIKVELAQKLVNNLANGEIDDQGIEKKIKWKLSLFNSVYEPKEGNNWYDYYSPNVGTFASIGTNGKSSRITSDLIIKNGDRLEAKEVNFEYGKVPIRYLKLFNIMSTGDYYSSNFDKYSKEGYNKFYSVQGKLLMSIQDGIEWDMHVEDIVGDLFLLRNSIKVEVDSQKKGQDNIALLGKNGIIEALRGGQTRWKKMTIKELENLAQAIQIRHKLFKFLDTEINVGTEMVNAVGIKYYSLEMEQEIYAAGVEIEKIKDTYDIKKSIDDIISIMQKVYGKEEINVYDEEIPYIETIYNEKIYLYDFINYRDGTISESKRKKIEEELVNNKIKVGTESGIYGSSSINILNLINPKDNELIGRVNIKSISTMLEAVFSQKSEYSIGTFLPEIFEEPRKELKKIYRLKEEEKLTPKIILDNEPYLKEALIMYIIDLAEAIYKKSIHQNLNSRGISQIKDTLIYYNKNKLQKIGSIIEYENKRKQVINYLKEELGLNRNSQKYSEEEEYLNLLKIFIIDIFRFNVDLKLFQKFIFLTSKQELVGGSGCYKRKLLVPMLALNFLMKIYDIYTGYRTWKIISDEKIIIDNGAGLDGLRFLKRINRIENKALKLYEEIRTKAKLENTLITKEYLENYRTVNTVEKTEERMIVDVLIKLYSENVPMPATVILKNFNGEIIKKPTKEDILYIQLYTIVRSQQELDAINALKGIDLLKFYMSATILTVHNRLLKDKIKGSFWLKMKSGFEKLLSDTGATAIDVSEALITYANMEKYFFIWRNNYSDR
ncbi:MAG: hypothetical protein ACTSSM_10355 [Promethearchaeota archaeon]